MHRPVPRNIQAMGKWAVFSGYRGTLSLMYRYSFVRIKGRRLAGHCFPSYALKNRNGKLVSFYRVPGLVALLLSSLLFRALAAQMEAKF